MKNEYGFTAGEWEHNGVSESCMLDARSVWAGEKTPVCFSALPLPLAKRKDIIVPDDNEKARNMWLVAASPDLFFAAVAAINFLTEKKLILCGSNEVINLLDRAIGKALSGE